MDFNEKTKVGDIAAANPRATKVLEQAGVDYCCGGQESLHDACVHAGVPAEEILARLRASNTETGPADSGWGPSSLGELTRHIREKHHRYVREAISRIRPLAGKVHAKHGENHPETADIERLFLALSQEMIMHMQKEEQILFPYIEALERSVTAGEPLEPPFFQTVRNPVYAMMKDHDSAGELTKQIRQISGDYSLPPDACVSYQALYQDLREFEADLHQHVHLENNILFPRAVEMERGAF